MEDCFSKDGRSAFIKLAINKLSENNKTNQNPFRTAFFKSMLSFRENISYVDVNYYLSFSALESLCRYIQNDYAPSRAPQIITTTLQNYGFNVSKKITLYHKETSCTIAHFATHCFTKAITLRSSNITILTALYI